MKLHFKNQFYEIKLSLKFTSFIESFTQLEIKLIQYTQVNAHITLQVSFIELN